MDMEGCELIEGDCLSVMRGMPTATVDAIVADPPAGISFMGKAFDSDRGGRASWVAWLAERMAEAARVVKPGHYALVWALPRSSHWTACAIEDAGWTLVERVSHIFGQGFPKSKARLKPAVEDWWLCRAPGGGKVRDLGIDACRVRTGDDLGRYSGKTALGLMNDDAWKAVRQESEGNPAGRYPSNLVFSHHPLCEPCGTKRVKGSNGIRGASTRIYGGGNGFTQATGESVGYADPDGTETVPAWRCVESGCPIAELDRQSGERRPGEMPARRSGMGYHGANGTESGNRIVLDSGGASRFFPTFSFEADDFAPFLYCSKASRKDRGPGNTHPTVKSTSLLRWLSRLITPPGGTILDPFMGSGSTGKAALAEEFRFIGIESDPDYFRIASDRLAAARAATPLFARTTGGV
jgi:hypothetical protein